MTTGGSMSGQVTPGEGDYMTGDRGAETEAAAVVSDSERDYQQAKADPLAEVILHALHKQDAATYHGNSGNTGALALRTAHELRERIAWTIHDDPGPDPSPADPAWWAGWREAQRRFTQMVRDLDGSDE